MADETTAATREVKFIFLSTENIDESVTFYTEVLGFPLKFRDGSHFAALDAGQVTLALATSADHPIPGKVVVGIKSDDPDRDANLVDNNGGAVVQAAHDDAHERRAVVYDNEGNGLVFYRSLHR
jgi:lactoylglutathione lyase